MRWARRKDQASGSTSDPCQVLPKCPSSRSSGSLIFCGGQAPDGPAPVVAPTSVCTNWLVEAARFAPTLDVRLFGGGDRGRMLSRLQPFDVVVVSYDLLQQEADPFAGVHWHTVVLDEVQAVKNAATKRSQAVVISASCGTCSAFSTPACSVRANSSMRVSPRRSRRSVMPTCVRACAA